MDAGLESKLHPQAIEAVKRLVALGLPSYSECASLQEARETSRAKAEVLAGTTEQFQGKVNELLIPSPQHDGVPVFVYKPNNLAKNPAIFIYFHGGGMVVGSRKTVDPTCTMIASLAGILVVNVEYRLCPENKFPAMMEDGECVTNWVLCNKISLGGTEESIVGVGGDSAGAHITASISHRVPGLQFQILVYPYVVSNRHFASYDEFGTAPGLDMKAINWFREKWTDRTEQLNDPKLAPLLYTTFDHLPPALFIVAECDPIRDHSYVYQEKLQSAGIHTEILLIPGALHGFFTAPAVYIDHCHLAYQTVVDFIRRMSHSG